MPGEMEPDVGQEAKDFYAAERRESQALGRQIDRVEDARQQFDNRNEANIVESQHKTKTLHEAEKAKSDTEDRRDANLWRAQQHLEANRPEYEEQAEEEANAALAKKHFHGVRGEEDRIHWDNVVTKARDSFEDKHSDDPDSILRDSKPLKP